MRIFARLVEISPRPPKVRPFSRPPPRRTSSTLTESSWMGRPYASEMEALSDTYQWARDRDTSELLPEVRTASKYPLLAIGSGGSLTTAHFLAVAHELHTGRLARSTTPLDLAAHDFLDGDLSVWILTAGGSNPDVLRAFEEAVRLEPRQLAGFCATTGSRLRELAEQYAQTRVVDFDVPIGSDGFLATNSLLASVVLLGQAYIESFAPCECLPAGIDELVDLPIGPGGLRGRMRAVCQPLWERDTLLVLHGPGTSSAAVDLESKFNEAALGQVQIADYRNFGHGRHHWLARNAPSTAVLALQTEADEKLSERTLRLLPNGIPVARVPIPGGRIRTQIGAVAASVVVAGLAGEARGIDPGRPRVSAWGRRLYRLPLGRSGIRPPAQVRLPPLEAAAIERKAEASIASLHCRGELSEWREAFASFRARLDSTHFGGVVFDYDGTLVDETVRRDPPVPALADALRRLVSAGISVGIATGRGDSVRDDLRTVLPRELWGRLTIAYYNGAEIGRLDEDAYPDHTPGSCAELEGVADLLRGDTHLNATCQCRERRWQVTIEPEVPASTGRIWERIQQLTRAHHQESIVVVRSGHSIDILPAHVTKRRIVDRMRKALSGGQELLCIGDRGCWPGNDFALLNDVFGLSVDEVSADPRTCWNIAPRGTRGVRATLAYLRALEPANDRADSALRFRTSLVRDA